MENSQPLATESFSYSWLTDRSPCPSDGNQSRKEQNFDFDVSFTGSPVSLVHADEIFSDGHIMPVYVDRKVGREGLRASTSVPPSPVLPYAPGSPFVSSKNQPFFLDKWRKTSKRILRKCFGFVCQTLGASRTSNRVDDLERKVCEVQSWSNSLQASPRPSSAYSVVDWSDIKKIGSKVDLYYGLKKVKSWSSLPQAAAATALPRLTPSNSCTASCDVESSIHEAILYCKRSIEK